MDLGTRIFWGVLFALASSSTYFGLFAEQERRTVLRGEAGAAVVTGDEVTLNRVIDGDTVLVTSPEGSIVSVRLIGIKSFNRGLDRAGAVAQITDQARTRLRSLLTGAVAKIELNSPPKDSHGRFLGHLLVDGDNISRVLLREGLVLVFPTYPFAERETFFGDQEAARAARLGLWRNPALSRRANRLQAQWQEQDR